MDKYEQKNNVNKKQGAYSCFSKLKQCLKAFLRQEFTWGKPSAKHERLPAQQQLFHHWWDLLFDFLPCHLRACLKHLRQPIDGADRCQIVFSKSGRQESTKGLTIYQ
ncbi:MAG: hypothetical protein BGO77_08040 [Caedibacter sp. 37-49]|nr:MAG: hypothetical protein BGO77_08040 [Caedibacter sp. 37-49]